MMSSRARKLQRLKAHLKAAYAYSELSYAERLKVGAVLIKDDRIISVGYNGMPSGGSNVCETTRPATREERAQYVGGGGDLMTIITKPQVVHAEQNVIAFAAKNGIATEEATLVITHSPCFECCKLLIQAGIKHIYYDQEYRDTDPIEFLRDYEITIERIENGQSEATTQKAPQLPKRDVHSSRGLPVDAQADQTKRKESGSQNGGLPRSGD